MAEVASEIHDADARVLSVELPHHLWSRIGAAIVDKDQLPRLSQIIHYLSHAAVEFREGLLLVEGRCDDGKVWVGHSSSSPMADFLYTSIPAFSA
jgi:hypothetical protein